MNLTPHDRQRLRQRMDACRLGSDDLALPEMAELATALASDAALAEEWESRQRSERLIAAAMQDLSVPPGLADRILVAAGRERSGATEGVEQAVAAVAEPSADVELPAKRRLAITRRQWSWIGGVALVLLAAVAVRQVWLIPPTQVTEEQLVASAQSWFSAALEQRSGESEAGTAPLPFPHSSVALPLRRWQKLPTKEEPSLIAFDLTGLQMEGSVFLFAAKTNKQYDVKSTPYTELPATGGLEIGAWQRGGILYVLVVDQKSNQRLESVLVLPKLAASPRRFATPA